MGSAGALKSAASANQYKEAYGHFASMISQCIQCHQVRRDWGVFDEVQLAQPKEEIAEEEKVQIEVQME